MNRRRFLNATGIAISVAACGTWMLSDRSSFVRADIREESDNKAMFQPDEEMIIYLASLAPSGHNTQPWFIKYIEPYHWIIGNDKGRWLPAVDPTQRETIISIGAFIQSLEYAANSAGYTCRYKLLAETNQDEYITEVWLHKNSGVTRYDTGKLLKRRTVRSGYLADPLKREDEYYILKGEQDFSHFIPVGTREYHWINEQTIEANRIQAFRDDAQKELAEWIRLSSDNVRKRCDGLTLASMELKGFPAWLLRNFYDQEDVMKNNFRKQGIDKVKSQVSQSAGWLILTSKDNSVATLLETGQRFQRIFLKVRDRRIAIHPMTQILEETVTKEQVNSSIGINERIQFIIRLGYLKNYPEPVSVRRPVTWFVSK